ncbi:hypothetical protein [Streptomyces sp. ZEA17I]|uniref:hypothetical protein n=1 Tax=Streptomyces sp. ZEA17I TaxID=2202516 RepID=UPI0015E838E4|nr:hypothetical protein [Streptomyces sp. ZEA17I]
MTSLHTWPGTDSGGSWPMAPDSVQTSRVTGSCSPAGEVGAAEATGAAGAV